MSQVVDQQGQLNKATNKTQPSSATDPLSGQLWGRYRIESLLGQGNRASVYLATEVTNGKRVGLRVLAPEIMEDPESVERFLSVVASAAQLNHPHILPIADYGNRNGIVGVARPYIEGQTLRQRMGTLQSAGQVLQFLRPIAEALDYAHQQGIVHGDLKPGNILLPSDDHPMLADLGTAHAVPEGNKVASNTTATFFGTPEYVSPEQVMGQPYDHRADLYSLAVIAYESLVGRTPFQGAGEGRSIAMAHVTEQPAAPETLNPEIGTNVSRTLLRGLAKRPDDRFANATSFINALSKALTLDSVETPSRLRVVPPVKTPEPAPASAAPARQWPIVPILLGVVGVAAVITILLVIRAQSATSAPPAPAPPAQAAIRPSAAPDPALTWYFTGGAPSQGGRVLFQVQNPGKTEIVASVSMIDVNGSKLDRAQQVAPGKTETFNVAELFSLYYGYSTYAIRISADSPIGVKRVITTPVGTVEGYGVSSERTSWQITEPTPLTTGTRTMQIANFTATSTSAAVSYRTADGKTGTRSIVVPPYSVQRLNLTKEFPDVFGTWTITSANVPIMAELGITDRAGVQIGTLTGEPVR